VDARVADLASWLVIGPFDSSRGGLDAAHALEREFVFGRMYPGRDTPVTWTIPKVEILGGLIDPLPWGTNYNWNYHNGGTAWAMQALAEATGECKYAHYANRFCDFHLEGIPFVEHQVKTLNAVESANHWIIETPLLDFTLAPSLPFIHRLRQEAKFNNRAAYVAWIERMIRYAREEQVRLPGVGIYTRTTPVKYTTWVDDMFMGIPFLLQAALLAANEMTRNELFDDAASQVLNFNSQVWDAEAELYVHARYFGNPAKLPHWSRCNGWAIWAMSEVLLHLPADHPKRGAVLEHFRRHAHSLARLQDASGFWFNVLDRPDSPKEVSGTAIFAMALARGVRCGWLEPAPFQTVIEQGWRALASQIEPDGTVHGICMGTMCTEDVEYYVRRPFYDNDTHGLFAVLFAAIEVEALARLPESKANCPPARPVHPLAVSA
jgi:unsaturated rhamnogalacturonyl hydrolase